MVRLGQCGIINCFRIDCRRGPFRRVCNRYYAMAAGRMPMLDAKRQDGTDPAGPMGSWLNRNILGISLTSLFSDMSHEMATAILPFFIVLDLGGTTAIVGLVEGASDGASSAVKSYSGYLSDRMGRRTPIMTLGYALTCFLIPAIGLCTSWLQVLALRVGAWMGRGARGPPRDALLADSAASESVGRAFGFQRSLDTVGAVVGPAIALLLIPHLPFSSIFFISFVPGVAAFFVVITLVRDIGTPRPKKEGFRSSMRSLPHRFKLLLVGVGLFGVANFSNVIFTLRAEQVLQPSLGPVEGSEYAVLLYVVLNVVYAIASYPVGRLADKVSKGHLLASGYVVFALACVASIVETPSAPILSAIFVLAGLQVAIVDTVEGAYASELLSERQRGSGFGVLQTVNGAGDFASSTLIGVLLTVTSAAFGFALIASMAVSAAALLVVLTRPR
jgi:MFS family permease